LRGRSPNPTGAQAFIRGLRHGRTQLVGVDLGRLDAGLLDMGASTENDYA